MYCHLCTFKTLTLPTPEAAEETRNFIKKAGGDSTWDRLAEYLTKESSDKDIFVINRTFNAPIEIMFDMWTNPKHFTEWMGPAGSTMQFFRSDIKKGGSTFYMMTGKGDFKLYGRAEYLEIEKPNRIVYTQQFCDENEKITRHPMASTWPETMLTVVTLAEEEPDKTRVTVAWEAYGLATQEETEAFVKERGGMTQGWTGSFDKLEDYLSSISA